MSTSRIRQSSMRATLALSLTVLLAASASIHAATLSFSINANGAKEVTAAGVPNQGDVNGSAIGTLTLDNGTGAGTTGSAIFSLVIGNIDGSFTGHHIHSAPSTTTGPVVVNFGDPATILTGTSASGTLTGTITGLPAATITSIFANPADFYYNLHSSSFPGGAVRDQLTPVPEPGSAMVIAFSACGLLLRRRRSS